MTPTPTTLAPPSVSSELSSTLSSSPTMRHGSSVPRDTYDPISKTRTSLPLPSPRKSWLEYERSSQTSRRRQCQRVHNHRRRSACSGGRSSLQELYTREMGRRQLRKHCAARHIDVGRTLEPHHQYQGLV